MDINGNNAMSGANVPVAYVEPWNMQRGSQFARSGDMPMSETKRSFQPKVSPTKKRFVKPKSGFMDNVPMSMYRSYPAPEDYNPRLSAYKRQSKIRTNREFLQHSSFSNSFSSLEDEEISTDAIISPRYRDREIEISEGMILDEDIEEDVFRLPRVRRMEGRNRAGSGTLSESMSSPSNSPARSLNRVNANSHQNTVHRKLFKTSDELIQSIHTNLNTNQSQSSEALDIKPKRKPPPNPHVTSAEDLATHPWYEPSHHMAVPKSSPPVDQFYYPQSYQDPRYMQHFLHPPYYPNPMSFYTHEADMFMNGQEWLRQNSNSSETLQEPSEFYPGEMGVNFCYYGRTVPYATPQLGAFYTTRSMGDVSVVGSGIQKQRLHQNSALDTFQPLNAVEGKLFAWCCAVSLINWIL